MKFFTKTRGAVSIFLVIILVPMMTVSALFVDASKVKLAQGVAESAGDLALNTALTDYDTQLKDLYGLFATAQDTSELFDKLESYYRTCIISSGVNESEANIMVDQIMTQLHLVEKSNDTADILNMQLIDLTVSKSKNADLANAALIKKEIVDFMKYRSPINTGLKFVSALQTFSTLSKQTELVEKRTEYYEQEQSVMEILQGTWEDIAEYNKLDIVRDENYFTNMNNNLKKWEEVYKQEINKKTIKDLYDTQDHADYHCEVYKLAKQIEKDAEGNEKYVDDVWKISYEALGSVLYTYMDYYNKNAGNGVQYFDKEHLPTAEDIKSILQGFYNNKNTLESYRAEIKSPPDNVYHLQYLVQTHRKCLQSYTSAACNFYLSYQKLKNAMIWVEGYDEDERNNLNNTKIKINGIGEKTISAYYEDATGSYDANMIIFCNDASVFTDYSNKYRVLTDYSGVNSKVAEIGREAGKYIETLEKGAEKLESASKKIKAAKTKVNGDLATAKSNWQNTANDSSIKNTSMARQDLAEIDELGTYLDVGYMEAMAKRLDDVALKLRETAGQIKNYKFDGTYVGDIQNYTKLKSVIKNKVGDSNLHNVELDSNALDKQADEWFDWQSGNLKTDWVTQSGKQPNLTKDKPNLYSYLYQHFNKSEDATGTVPITENKSEGKDTYKSLKQESGKKAEEEATGVEDGSSAPEIKGQSSDLPSKYPSESSAGATPSGDIETGEDATKNVAKSLSSMFSDLAATVTSQGVDLRDNLYIADYILSMFSYNTIEAEHEKINETKAADKKEDTLRTLTLQEINADNNVAYQYEVEYIIYGGNNKSNITKAYGSIYAIRFGFNLIYAFSSSAIRDTALAVATPISAATLGVIPVPLIQAAIIIGITCIESGIDLVDLKKGESVPLFKNDKTWHCSVKGLINEVKDITGEALKKSVDYASGVVTDKLNEILDMADEEINKNIDSITNDLVQQIDTVFMDLITRHVDSVIQKVTTLADSAIENHMMNPAINTKQYVEEGLDKWLAQEAEGVDTSSNVVYIIKKEAVDLVKSEYIDGIISAIEKTKNSVGGTIDLYGSEILDKIAEVKNGITAKVINASGEVSLYKEKMKNSVKESIAGGAESIRTELNKQIDGIFGSGGSEGSDCTGIASLLSFRYSDYLRLFLIVGLYANEEGVLLRTADVIQVNMAKKNKGFLMKNAAVYIDIDATIQVKPTLLALPLFADVRGNPVNNQNWYTFTYKDVRGY